jgi:catechol 2,3-dioxygenase
MTQGIVGPGGRADGIGSPGDGSGRTQASLLDTAPYRVGSVTLVARDLNVVARFYRTVVGLSMFSQEADLVRLGAGDRVLLELRHDPAARPSNPRDAGLFHTAFLLPGRGDLGAWLKHASERGIRLSGASDHLVSEAVYLTDPEGNGIEIYVDRPSAEWPHADGGTVIMRNDALDYDGLVRAAPGPWTGMPPGGRVGHVHLQVGALEPAERFYVGLLGFDVMCRYPGATFLGAGGYHHQLATNTCNSQGAPGRPVGTTGLAEVAMHADAETLATVRARAGESGSAIREEGFDVVLHDPWGTRLRLLTPEDTRQTSLAGGQGTQRPAPARTRSGSGPALG